MLAELIAGQRDPKAALAQLGRSRMRTKIGQLEEAFVAHFTDHHAVLLARMLSRVDAISADIADLDTRIEAEIAPFAPAVARLDEIPGVRPTVAHVIIAEIGLDMSRFPTAAHLTFWARLARSWRGGRGRRQDQHLLRLTLPTHRPPMRKEEAIVAVGRSILLIVRHLLSDPEARFHGLGPGFNGNRLGPEPTKRNHIRQLEALGYKVTLEPAA